MKDNEWIRFSDDLPNLNKEIEVLCPGGKVYKTKALLSSNLESIVFNVNENTYDLFNISRLMGWRYIPENRPDFSRLNYGDLICAHSDEKDKIFGIIRAINYEEIIMIGGDKYHMSYLKKITRINLEEKTFEDI